jgi:N-methylhydantoinase B
VSIGPPTTLDPVLLAVLANRMESIVREMTNTLMRSGRSAVLNTARDFSCSIVTADNRLLASAEGLPIHVIGTQWLAEAMTELHDDLAEGDAFLHNDPYLGNSHSADHAILVPVFVKGEHVFTAVAKAHQADCGNSLPTTYMPAARDVYEEGALNFPCVAIQRGYRDIADIVRMCRRRIRVPDQWYGDYLAALGSARIAERRLGELCAEHGLETVRTFVAEWLDYSERRMVAAIRRIPRGTLVGWTTHDPYPGLPDGIPLTVTLAIDPDDGWIDIDLRDNPDNYAGGLNESRACATAAVVCGLFNSLDPDIPHNDGSFRRVRVHLRDGCIAGIPRFPHSCSMATTDVADRLICATQAAFAALGDGFGLAEGANGIGAYMAVVSGRDARLGGAPYVNQIFVGGAGGPASAEADGWPTYMLPVVAALMYHDSTEVDEQKYPFHVYEKRLIADSGGAGRRRGGLGTLAVYGPKDLPMTAAFSVEGHFNLPQGVRGGLPGGRSDVWKLDVDGRRVDVPKAAALELEPGERLVSVSNGGGGYGNPHERDPALVLEDVLEGFVSRAHARDVYGVVFAGDEVDAAATRARRAGSPAP